MGVFRKITTQVKSSIENAKPHFALIKDKITGHSEVSDLKRTIAKKTKDTLYRSSPANTTHRESSNNDSELIITDIRLEQSPWKSLILTLRSRFMANPDRHRDIHWFQLESKLLATSTGKMRSLNEMERTGGEPDVVGKDKKTGEYIFMDCSSESPVGRRNCLYYLLNKDRRMFLKAWGYETHYSGIAVDMANMMGVKILSEEEYLYLQTKGVFDVNSSSWIEKHSQVEDIVTFYYGTHQGGGKRKNKTPSPPGIVGTYSSDFNKDRGFRASLRI